MKMKHVLVAFMVLGLAFTMPAPAFSQAKSDTIKIGAFLPMTGGVAAYGQGSWQGIQAARDMKPTILGKKVELFLADDKSDKIEAANAVTRLIEKEKVIAIIGSSISGNTMAGAPDRGEGRRSHHFPHGHQPPRDAGQEVHLPRVLHRPLPGRDGRQVRL